MKKTIVIDSSTLFFPAVFSWERQKQMAIEAKDYQRFIMPAHCVYFSSILSCLKKIGVDEETTIVIPQEGKSWRKKYMGEYKAQRADDRDKHKLINWDKEFQNLNRVNQQLDEATDWHFVREWNSENDDFCAVAPKVFSDQEVIIVTCDKDLHMLAYYPNVKIFNVNKKCKGTKGIYEKVENPIKILKDKIRLGDVSDNIIVDKENDTPEDAMLRAFVIDLINLPKFVEEPIVEILKNLPKKELHLDKLPNFKNVKEKFLKIYEKDNVVTPEYCYQLLEKREKAKLKKKKEKKNDKV